jgi:hypothetical protein
MGRTIAKSSGDRWFCPFYRHSSAFEAESKRTKNTIPDVLQAGFAVKSPADRFIVIAY